MTRQIGVMGGMFDPVHNGHIAAANAALNCLNLDELRLVPCATPYHRDSAFATPEDRVAMLELAVGTDSRLVIDDRELTRQGISFTVDTLLSLHVEFPGSTFVLILGSDAFKSLPTWHRWRELFGLAHVCVVNRPESEFPTIGAGELQDQMCDALTLELRNRQTVEPLDFLKAINGYIYLLDNPAIDLSSSFVRAQLERGILPELLLPQSIADYIAKHNLYNFKSN